jgi:hypothetical protein
MRRQQPLVAVLVAPAIAMGVGCAPTPAAREPAANPTSSASPTSATAERLAMPTPFTWQSEPYVGKGDPPGLREPACAFVEAEVANAKASGLRGEAFLQRLNQAGASRGEAGAKCLGLFKEAMAAYVDASKNVEAVVALKALARGARSRASAHDACLASTPPVPSEASPAPYTAPASEWLDPGWQCLHAQYTLGGAGGSYFRYAFFLSPKDRVFVAAAERLDTPGTVLFVRGSLDAVDEPVVQRRTDGPSVMPLLETYRAQGGTAAQPATKATDPGAIVLEGFGTRMALPTGWTVKHRGRVATALAPGGKSGFVFYATRDVGEGPTFLHMADEAFHVEMPFAVGKVWVSAAGLRLARSEKEIRTTDGRQAHTVTLLGAVPDVPGSALGVLAVIDKADVEAEQALKGALDTLAPR